ncbi:toxin-activating lysine-acyltransferase [Raoultella sp. RIT712]|uniref:toxin-activating lysine-acyltransferase n=1 Tax=unclassified Raoultella TaxID=2627600 RepID=UPI0012AE62FE|nr:toxin-activating lysine-acyltransferase [Raoultella sp. RIT712]MRT47646.1 toxin-activating lysine-acyltransferase [Raoultella sp. RIT712]
MRLKISNDNFCDDQMLGAITRLHFERDDSIYEDYKKYLKLILIPAIEMKNIHVVTDVNDFVVGYFIWAFVPNEVHCKLLNKQQVQIYSWDWNGGDFLWILDYRYPRDSPLSLIHRIHECFSGEEIYTFYGEHGLMFSNLSIQRF